MNAVYYLACDLGVESGHVVLGTLSRGQLSLREIHSFANKTHQIKGRACRDLVSLEQEIFSGIEKAAVLDLPLAGLSADSWGVDYVLLDENQRPLQAPVCGGAKRSEEAPARLLKKLSPAMIYAETGLPLLPLRTLFQIEAECSADPTLFQRAECFLPIADYCNARFSGVAVCEESLASTTQLYNPQSHAWSPPLVAALDLPGPILPRLVPGGTVFGPVTAELRRHPALLETRVIATCSHAIAAAIAAVPARNEQRWACLHADVRSQFGVELGAPNMSHRARAAGFANEAGLGGSIHFFKDCAGPGLLWTCRRAWAAAGRNYSEEDLSRLAIQNGPAQAHIAPEDPRFRAADNLPAEIAAYCRDTGQPLPERPGEIVRTVLESLALACAEMLRQLETLTGQEIEVLHVVGRGSGNDLLNQLIADATGLPVIAGPADAAVIGNILVQALALRQLKSPGHLRSIVSSSFPTRILKPGQGFGQNIRNKFQALSERPGLLGAPAA